MVMRYRDRNVVCCSIVDFLVTAAQLPLTPRSDDCQLRSQSLYGQFETNLVVAFAGSTVSNSVSAFFSAISTNF